MAPNTKRVFYVNALSHLVYLEFLAKRPDIHVDKLDNDSPEDEAARDGCRRRTRFRSVLQGKNWR